MAAEVPSPESPRFIIDEGINNVQRQALLSLEAAAQRYGAQGVLDGIDLYTKGPELVKATVQYVDTATGGREILDAWDQLKLSGAGIVGFDDATEDALAKDPDHKKLIEQSRTASDKDKARLKETIKDNRFKTFLGRLVSHQTTTVEQPSATSSDITAA